MNTKEEAIATLLQRGYWRVSICNESTKQGCMVIEICTSKKEELLNVQQYFGGKLRKQDSIWRYYCGKKADIAMIGANILRHAKVLGTEMLRYAQSRGEQRYRYVVAIKEKYQCGNSIKLSKFTNTAIKEKSDE